MSDSIHREEFIYVPHASHDRVVLAWGAFFFRRSGDEYTLIDHDALEKFDGREYPPRFRGSIGFNSDCYGAAEVRLYRLDADRARTDDPPIKALQGLQRVPETELKKRVKWLKRHARIAEREGRPRPRLPVAPYEKQNHVYVAGLKPDTRYEYEVWIDGKRWAGEPSEPDSQQWSAERAKGVFMAAGTRPVQEFRIFPAPDARQPVAFLVLGDPGTRKADQRAIAAKIQSFLETPSGSRVRFVVTTGDNIYVRGHGGGELMEKARRVFDKLRNDTRSSGDEDDDWFDSYFWPYRGIISRLPVYPCLGNHDSAETEHEQDLLQLVENFYLAEAFPDYAPQWITDEADRTALFYEFRCGALLQMICMDTSTPGMEISEHILSRLPG